jgi:hypothetical protein
MMLAELLKHPRTRHEAAKLRAQTHLLTVSPLRAAREGVRSFRLMVQLLLHAQVPMPR